MKLSLCIASCCFLLFIVLFSANAVFAADGCPKRLHPESLQKRHGFKWILDQSASFDYFFEPSSPAARDIASIKDRMEGYRTRVTRLLGDTPPPFRVLIFLAGSTARMNALCGYEFSWACGTTMGIIYGGGISAVGAHEDCHIVASRLWGPNREKWSQEGLAVYSDDHWDGFPLHALCKQLKSTGKLVPIQLLIANGWERRYSSRVTYPELGSFVKFLYDKYGVGSLKSTWQQGAGKMRQIYGKDLAELEKEWLSIIDASDAQGIAYSPE